MSNAKVLSQFGEICEHCTTLGLHVSMFNFAFHDGVTIEIYPAEEHDNFRKVSSLGGEYNDMESAKKFLNDIVEELESWSDK